SMISCQQSLKADATNPKIQLHGYYHSASGILMPPQNVNYRYFDNLSVAFLRPSSDGKGAIKYNPQFSHQEFVELAHKNKVKALIALGDLGEKLESDDVRQRFINETISFIKKYNYDGVDIDWEFRASYGTTVKPLI